MDPNINGFTVLSKASELQQHMLHVTHSAVFNSFVFYGKGLTILSSPLQRRLCFHSIDLFVCPSVRNITQTVRNRLRWNLMEGSSALALDAFQKAYGRIQQGLITTKQQFSPHMTAEYTEAPGKRHHCMRRAYATTRHD